MERLAPAEFFVKKISALVILPFTRSVNLLDGDVARRCYSVFVILLLLIQI